MPYTPPINRRANRDLLKRDRFFRLLAQECAKFADKETTFLVYMMMVSMVGEQLRRHEIVRLPHLADVALVTQKPRPGWCGKTQVHMGPRKVLKIYPNYHLRRVFNKRQDF